MAEKTLKMIRIKWVRSGIGFTYHQKTIVRSLGLNKLNHTVVRPDTPQIRGIVAAVPHLLEIVPEPRGSGLGVDTGIHGSRPGGSARCPRRIAVASAKLRRSGGKLSSGRQIADRSRERVLAGGKRAGAGEQGIG